MSEKNKLAEKLLYAPKNGYDRLSAEDEKAMEAYCEDYKKFLNNGKTERLCVEYCIELAEKKGFKAYEAGMKLSAGDKVYFNNRGKGIMLAVIGSEDLSHGANIGAAHTDSPRLDLKPRPLYEEAEMAYFKTHHYGGIRKYQWVTIPLELHGVVVLRDGSKVDVHIGGREEDPQFIINDLLPHLGREQGKKPLNEAIPSESLNVLLKGLLRSGDHVLVSAMEHNAVMRPLLRLPEVSVSRLPCDSEGFADIAALPGLLRDNTRLVVMAHGSNVCGTVQDAEAIGRICAEHGVPFALDAAQTAGHLPIDFSALHLSALAVPGHKGLLGPGGTGALLLRDDLAQRLTPLTAGGTGSASDSEYLPDYLPDKFESGTANLPGYYGWEAALRFVEETGVPALREHEMALCSRFLQGLEDIPHVRLCGTRDLSRRVGVISVDFLRRDNAEAAYALETEYGILTRCGLHCAPTAHRTLGTFPQGTVRFSLGFASTEADVDAALHALRALA